MSHQNKVKAAAQDQLLSTHTCTTDSVTQYSFCNNAVASHCLQIEDENGPDNQLIDSMHLDNDLK